MLETHACAVPGCREACPSSHLMCVRHWRMVPASLQRSVRRAYVRWRCATRRDSRKEAADALRIEQQLAIAAVVEKEVKRDLAKREGQDTLFSP